MEVKIRRAIKEDGEAMMQLVKELALYEKAPQEVTVDFDHFLESGFGEKPVWWAFVAEVDEKGCRLCFILYSLFHLERTKIIS